MLLYALDLAAKSTGNCYLNTGGSCNWSCQGHIGNAAPLLQPQLAPGKLGGRTARTSTLLQVQQLCKLNSPYK